MASTKYSDITSEILPFLAAFPPEPTVENATKRAVIELCARSWIWKYLPDPIDVDAAEPAYGIDLLPGSELAAVLSATLDGARLTSKSTEWLDKELPTWRSDSAQPKYYTQLDTEQILLAPIPDSTIAGGLVLTIALKPSIASTSFPKWIASKYLYDIANGAAANLMLMSGKPWADPQNGAYRKSLFDQAISAANASSAKALGRGAIRTAAYFS